MANSDLCGRALELVKDYAARSGSVYLDYYSALAAGRAMKKELTVDGRDRLAG